MARDRRGLFHAVSRQRCPSPPMTDELNARLGREIVVWTKDKQYLGGADAVLFLLEKTGLGWIARLLALPPFIWVGRVVYRLIAKNRLRISRWLRLPATCPIESR